MTDTARLNRLIEESNESKESIAAKLGISLSSLNNKIANRTEFKASEIEALTSTLEMDRQAVFEVFLCGSVSQNDTFKVAANA